MVKKYLNKKGNAYIWLILFIVLFIGISTLVIDYGNLYIKTKKIKYSMNNAVKAAALQIKDGEELANGEFKIDEKKAKEIFLNVLANNLALNTSTLEPKKNSILFNTPKEKEWKVENNTPTNYFSATINHTYNINNPSVIAVYEFEIKGLFLKTDIRVAELSSSQLTSIYD